MRTIRILPIAAVLAAVGSMMVFLTGAHAAGPPFSSPYTTSVFPYLSPEQARVLQDVARKGELTPEARDILRSNPELIRYIPAEWRDKIEAELNRPEGEGADNVVSGPLRLGEKAAEKGAAEGPAQTLPASYDWKRSVYVARLFLSRLDEKAAELFHFGHELFDPRPEAPVVGDSFPVSDDYVIGPGDEIVVKLWGRMEGTHRMQVDRDGKIFFPKLGSMYVTGKSFRDLRRFLQGKLGPVREVFFDLSLGQLKGFQVQVLGEVRAPGRYQVSSFHTVVQAIGMAGGAKDIGSLRRIQVRRGKELTAEIDLYDFLLKGDTTADIPLRRGDVIFVPVAGPLVAVTGEVRRQAIYELSREKTIQDVLAMAGGLSPSAYKRHVQVERLEGNRARVVVDLDLENADPSPAAFAPQDGDILRIHAISPEGENVVEVEGNVERPGRYEWKPGLTVGTLIRDEKFFLPSTHLDYALITRLVGPEKRKEAVPVNLRRAVIDRDPASDVALQPLDVLTVYRETAFRDERTATVGGEVREPGEYEVFPGMRVSDLVMLGGGLTRNASLGEAELSRRDDHKKVTVTTVSLAGALAGEPEANVLIQDEDHLLIRPQAELQGSRYVTISGEVVHPGIYAVRKDEHLSSVIRRAGGFTRDAFPGGAVYTRLSVQKRQQELIRQTIDQLEQEVSRTAAREGAVALDREDLEAQKQIFEARKVLLAKLKQVRAQGRVIIRLAEPGKLEGTVDDLVVENGDKLEVPRPAEVINVMGRVYNPTAVVYDPSHRTAGHYLRKVGGPTEDADKKHIFIVRADGSVVTKENAEQRLWLFGSGDFVKETQVGPGDAVVVPEKLEFARGMKDVKDITQILYQIAVTAGVLLVAF